MATSHETLGLEPEALNETHEPWFLTVSSACHTELGDHAAGFALPIHKIMTKSWIDEMLPDDVSLTGRVSIPIHQNGFRAVPGQDIPPEIPNMSRHRFEGIQKITKDRRYHFGRFSGGQR